MLHAREGPCTASQKMVTKIHDKIDETFPDWPIKDRWEMKIAVSDLIDRCMHLPDAMTEASIEIMLQEHLADLSYERKRANKSKLVAGFWVTTSLFLALISTLAGIAALYS